MSKYFTLLPLFGLLLFTGCSQKEVRYSAVPNYKSPSSSKYNFDIVVPQAEYEFSNERLAKMIKELEGKPYVWAEEGPACFDCSGYLFYMYGKMGIQIPRVAREQIKQGIPVEMSNLKFGDFIFFDTTKNRSGKISHVGIYLKDGWFSHASSSNGKTTYANLLTNKFYNERFRGARRYAQENSYTPFEPKLSMYAINTKGSELNEVTTYANNNAKPTPVAILAYATPKAITAPKTTAVVVAMAEKPKVLTTPSASLTMPNTTAPVALVASAMPKAVSVPNVTASVGMAAMSESPKITTTTAQRLATVPTAIEPSKVVVASLEPMSSTANTTIEVTNSTEIAINREPINTTLDIKTSEIMAESEIPKVVPKVVQIAKVVPKPVVTKVAQPKAPAKANTTGYYVQLGKFQNKPNNDLLKKITKNGYAYTLMPTNENGKSLSKLLIGPFKDKKDAGSTLNSVKDNIEQAAFVTKVNS